MLLVLSASGCSNKRLLFLVLKKKAAPPLLIFFLWTAGWFVFCWGVVFWVAVWLRRFSQAELTLLQARADGAAKGFYLSTETMKNTL